MNGTSPAAASLYGLVLTGGHSRRMQRDKAGLAYAGRSQLQRAMQLLAPRVERTFVSIRAEQRTDPARATYACITDLQPELGPIGRDTRRPACTSGPRLARAGLRSAVSHGGDSGSSDRQPCHQSGGHRLPQQFRWVARAPVRHLRTRQSRRCGRLDRARTSLPSGVAGRCTHAAARAARAACPRQR